MKTLHGNTRLSTLRQLADELAKTYKPKDKSICVFLDLWRYPHGEEENYKVYIEGHHKIHTAHTIPELKTLIKTLKQEALNS